MIERYLLTTNVVEVPELVAERPIRTYGDDLVLTVTKVVVTTTTYRLGTEWTKVDETVYKVETWDNVTNPGDWHWNDEIGQFDTEADAMAAFTTHQTD